MQIFYLPDISGSLITLSEEESKHCIRVLRMSQGDEIDAVDGKGTYYSCIIVEPNPKHCKVSVSRRIEEFGKRNFHLHIAMAPTKNIDRFEWFLEKATEIGIDEVTPLLCLHSERKSVNVDRLQRVMVSAMKQSEKAYLPLLNPMIEFSQFINLASEHTKLIAYCGDFNNTHISKHLIKGSSVLVLIGPEGDFSPDEINAAKNNNFIITGLGNSRLRTETAGVVACTIANSLNE